MTARLLAVFLIFSAAVGATRWLSRPEPDVPRAPLSALPPQIGDWKGANEPLDAKVLRVLGVDDVVNRVYGDRQRQSVALYIGFYKSQRAGKTIHSPLKCLPGTGWQPIETGVRTLSVTTAAGSAQQVRINRYVVQKSGERHVVYFWYQMHGHIVTSEYVAKLMLIDGAVRTNRTDGSLVRVFVPVGTRGESEADAIGASFIRDLFPLLGDYLPA
jgi:EpsI family protein